MRFWSRIVDERELIRQIRVSEHERVDLSMTVANLDFWTGKFGVRVKSGSLKFMVVGEVLIELKKAY